MAVHLLQLRLNGQTGDLGAAAVRAAAEEGQRGNAHAAVGQQPARGIPLRQDFVAATLVQVGFM